MFSQYRILGTSDDEHSCCLCGRTDLKRVVWLENTEDGSRAFYGTDCAARLLAGPMGAPSQANVKKWAEQANRVERFLSSRIAAQLADQAGMSIADWWQSRERGERKHWLNTSWAAA